METDIGNPIEYDPSTDPFIKSEEEKNEDSTPINEQQYYFQPPEMMYPPQQQFPMEKTDFISSIDKTTWIVAFAVFLLGFFMGKTMQPVILRYAWVSCESTNVPIDVFWIHHIIWIFTNFKYFSWILNEPRSCWCRWLTFVLWNHLFTWFKKQNKERTCQNYG